MRRSHGGKGGEGDEKSERQKACIKDRKPLWFVRKKCFVCETVEGKEGERKRERVHAWERIQVGGTELIN